MKTTAEEILKLWETYNAESVYEQMDEEEKKLKRQNKKRKKYENGKRSSI